MKRGSGEAEGPALCLISMPDIHLRARAKINLGLRILGRRPDGYHELRTVFQTLALADRLRLTYANGRSREIELRIRPDARAMFYGGRAGREAAVAEWLAVPEDENNLAARAARLAMEACGLRGRLEIELRKAIPVGAGLGGGSSDAAAVLRGVAALAPRRPPETLLWELAAKLGSDVPFFLLGGAALGLGRGEELYPLPALPAWHCVVALPRRPSATAHAYRAWDALHPQALTEAETLHIIKDFHGLIFQTLPVSRLRDRERVAAATSSKVHTGIENDFEAVVLPLSPDFRSLARAMARTPARFSGLSGSGAARYALFERAETARRMASELTKWGPVWISRLSR